MRKLLSRVNFSLNQKAINKMGTYARANKPQAAAVPSPAVVTGAPTIVVITSENNMSMR